MNNKHLKWKRRTVQRYSIFPPNTTHKGSGDEIYEYTTSLSREMCKVENKYRFFWCHIEIVVTERSTSVRANRLELEWIVLD